VLGKGMVTLPKKWRDEMGLGTGDIVKAKKEGNAPLRPNRMRKNCSSACNSKRLQF
jgi:AbrB family looped-hinge helix DNA binding protein